MPHFFIVSGELDAHLVPRLQACDALRVEDRNRFCSRAHLRPETLSSTRLNKEN